MNEQAIAWIAFAISSSIFVTYEGWVLWVGRRHPDRMARYAHARLRVAWAAALGAKPGFEIVAVQNLRNSLMSATIAASTAALALMGTITLAGSGLVDSLSHLRSSGIPSPRLVLEGLLMLALFASYVCSSMAMRYFNHTGFVMSMPVDCEERKPVNPLATEYVERAGLLYSWGLRFFLMIAPLVAGIVNPLLMPVMTIILVFVLWWFDRPARMLT
jgi:hypothetical protein